MYKFSPVSETKSFGNLVNFVLRVEITVVPDDVLRVRG